MWRGRKSLALSSYSRMIQHVSPSVPKIEFSVLSSEAHPPRHLTHQIILNWNNIYGVGLEHFAYGLAVNKGLKILDLSWNLLGRIEDDPGASQVLECFIPVEHIRKSKAGVSRDFNFSAPTPDLLL